MTPKGRMMATRSSGLRRNGFAAAQDKHATCSAKSAAVITAAAGAAGEAGASGFVSAWL